MKATNRCLFSFLIALALVLTMLPAVELPVQAAETDPIRYPSDVTSYEAVCPVCKTTVTWKPYNGENDSNNSLKVASHLYLTKDTTYTKGKTFLLSYRDVCFNFNGYDLTVNQCGFATSRTINFVDTYGGSVITGYGTSTGGAGAVSSNSVNAHYNLYGGTWTKTTDNPGSNAAYFGTQGGEINLYDGAVIDGAGDVSSERGGALRMVGGYSSSNAMQKATFNMYGGVIRNGNVNVGVPGDAYMGCAFFNMYGGTIESNVYVNNKASFTMNGGTITGNLTAATDTKITLSGASQIQGSLSLGVGVSADIAKLTSDASIVIGTVVNGQALTSARTDAETLRDVFTTTDGRTIFLGKDNIFYIFSDGVAILDADNNVTLYETAEKALSAYYAQDGFAKGSVLLVGAADQTITLVGDAYVDAAGKNLTVNGTGKLYGMDSGNDNFNTCARWTIGENVTIQNDVVSPVNGGRYIFAEGGYHRLDLAITHVNLRTAGEPGMYYKARIRCDETLANLVTGYGTALSVDSLPGIDYAQKDDVKYTAFDKAAFTALYQDHQVSTNSCALVGVLKTENTADANTANAKSKVYANLYVNMELNGEAVTLLDKGVACSLSDLVEAISVNWSKYSASSKSTVRKFVNQWNSYVSQNTFPELKNDIQVGFGRTDITPDYSVPLAGYGNTSQRMSTDVKYRIYATCIAITEESGNTLLLITQDLISSDWTAEAQAAIFAATGVPASNIMVASTHTHAAPDIRSSMDVIQKDYKRDYLAWITEAAVAAMADRSPATPHSGSTTLEKMNSVRHYLMSDGTYAGNNFGSFSNKTIVAPAEEADKDFQLIHFIREGKQAVTMVNWQAHVTYGTGSSLTKISSCFVGVAREHYEKNTGNLFAYFTGACGNINATSEISDQNRAGGYTEYGQILSRTAIDMVDQLDETNILDFKTKAVTFTGQVDHSMEDKLEEATIVNDIYITEGLAAGNKEAKKYGFSSAYHANAVVRRSKYGQTMSMDISAFYLGDISFVAAPYEMFAAHGTYIKENTSGMTFVLTSCNGRYGYIPTNKAYDYGCYESHTGNFARGTGDQLAQAYANMLNELSGEAPAEKEQLAMRYDDHYDVSGKAINILNAGTPTSCKVGTNEKDASVVTLVGDNLIATGIGTAQVKIDDTVYNITVEAAPISLVMITGHSIGAGQNGDPNYSVVGPAGQVYSSHGTENLDANTAGVGISYGATVKANNVNAFTEASAGTKGEGSGLAWQWNNLTGEKIWVLNTAVGGSCLPEWIPGETYYENAVTQFQRAQVILENEVKAGHYTLSQMGIIYHNGANFSYKNVVATQSDYETWYEAMWSGFKSETSRDMDGNGKSESVSFLGLVPIWTISGGISYSSDEPAGLYMAASKEYPEIFTASLIGQNWLTDANVAEKFPESNYTMQASGDYQRPNLTVDVFASDKVHYQQVAYNALGIDIANNLYAWLNAEDNNPELAIYNTSLMLDLTDTLELTVGEAWVLSPVTNLNDLTFTASGCIELKYPLQIVAIGEGTGILTISNGSFTKEITFICKNPSDNP